MTESITAVVLAAGVGTRMKSSRAKVLHEIGGRTMVAHCLAAVRGIDPTRTIVVVGHNADEVGAHLDEVAPDALRAVQAEQRGTGHAVLTALQAIDSPPAGTVLVTYADVPLLQAETLAELLASHFASGSAVTILTSELDDPTGYGRILRAPDGSVQAIREHRDATDAERGVREVNSGILAVDGAFLAAVLPELEPANAQGELYLTDIVERAVAEDLPVGAHVLEDVWQTEGVNDRAALARVGAELNRRIGEHWMRSGVTIIDPASTWIDSAVTLAPDVTILPNTQLLGATVAYEGATIGPDTTLRNVEVGSDATVVRTHGQDAVIGDGASVGPFSYLRPGTQIGADAKVGTFVETKNAHLAPGAKVPHLSYIGDAEIGEGTNIGAGAITANYDGQHKHRTAVGRQVRTGSGNVFVAPVSIGDGAYTAAGSTIRDDVPAGALAIGNAEQRIIAGWVEKHRPGTESAEAAREAHE